MDQDARDEEENEDYRTAKDTIRRLVPEIRDVREAMDKRVFELEEKHGVVMLGLKKVLWGAENGVMRCKERREKQLKVQCREDLENPKP